MEKKATVKKLSSTSMMIPLFIAVEEVCTILLCWIMWPKVDFRLKMFVFNKSDDCDEWTGSCVGVGRMNA